MAEFPRHPFLLSVDETAQALSTNIDKGLTSAQVAQLHQEYPKNELNVAQATPWYSILTKQLLNAMIIVRRHARPPCGTRSANCLTRILQVLVFAMALSFGIQDYIEGGVLAFVIVLNVTIGFWQEYRAEKRMDALRSLSSPSAMVLRDGNTKVIPKSVAPFPALQYRDGQTKRVAAPKLSRGISSCSRWVTRSRQISESSKP